MDNETGMNPSGSRVFSASKSRLYNKRNIVNRNLTRWWLYLICLFVFAMTIIGGATRLTDSGLSITEWKPLLGVLPPLSHSDWLVEFEKYKQIPQYKQINDGMSLNEFQFIYWWEWAHRFLGRIVGLVFIIPLIFLYMTRRLEPGLKSRLLFLFALGAFQGGIGWWMVSSGLTERSSVSQYRLAAHLVIACFIFSYALWIALGLSPRKVRNYDLPPKIIRILAMIIVFFLFVQIFLGGLVAGLDAGLVFNDWPLMDNSVIPESLFIIEPGWLNFFENPGMVQFVHRIWAYTLIFLIIANFIITLKLTADHEILKKSAVMTLIALMQVISGIITLVLQTPLNWALFHQAGAIILLAAVIFYWRGLVAGYQEQRDTWME